MAEYELGYNVSLRRYFLSEVNEKHSCVSVDQLEPHISVAPTYYSDSDMAFGYAYAQIAHHKY